MGHPVTFSLTVWIGGETIEEIFAEIEDDDSLALDVELWEVEDDWASWEGSNNSDYEGDMRQLSQRYPDCVFLLISKGDFEEERFEEYYKNGKMQHCEEIVVTESYDESKLK